MEPVTHFLFGAAMGRAGLNRKTALATATLTLAAEAPDLDVFSRFGGSAFGLNHHRGFTHSFLGVPLVAAVVVGFIYLLWRLAWPQDPQSQPSPALGIAFRLRLPCRPQPHSSRLHQQLRSASLLAVLRTLDFLGHRLHRRSRPPRRAHARPDSSRTVFAHQRRDRRAQERPAAAPQGRLAATLALIAVFAYWGLRDFEHRRAVAALEARTYQGADAIRVSAYPYVVNPFRWHGVVETPAFFATMDVDSIAPEVDPEGRMQIRYKPEETPVTLAAKRTYLGRVYLSWAHYPVTETEQMENDPIDNSRAAYLVRFRDLRYDSPGTNARGMLGAQVFLTRDLQVVDERFGMGSRHQGRNSE